LRNIFTNEGCFERCGLEAGLPGEEDLGHASDRDAVDQRVLAELRGFGSFRLGHQGGGP
jgi:hypothetical protein